MTRLTRVGDRVRQSRYLFAERRVRLALGSLAVLVALLGVIAVLYPDQFLSLFFDSLLTALFAIVALFVSYDLLLRYSHRTERERIADDETVIERYEDRVPLMNRSTAPGWRGRFVGRQPNRLPFVADYVPETPRPVSSYEVRIDDEVYSHPDRLSLLLDPVEVEQRERFQSEGHYNSLKAGLVAIEDGTFRFRTESYFQAFRTTHSPDYELYRGRSLRDLTDHMLFEDGGLTPLSRSPFPNAFGGGGLVLTRDGRAVIPIRSAEVAYATGEAEVSYGGSFDLPLLEETEDMADHYYAELEEELAIPSEQVVEVYCLGVIRRLELLGSPDMLILTIVEEDVAFENASRENVRLIRMNLLPDRSNLSLEDLLDPDVTATLAENLFDRLDAEGYLPGTALTATVALLAQHADAKSD